ncbi:unnamed protein product [Effrenium voratum]|nr:unnamed protein product [Effrenium voratum]
MAQAMDMAEMSGLVVRNTFLEFSGQDNCFEENLPNQRTRAFSDILDTKLPWKVPITSNLDSGLFQITRCVKNVLRQSPKRQDLALAAQRGPSAVSVAVSKASHKS